MTRFEGAVTKSTEPTDSTAPPAPERPPRPILVEVSAAILIVGGLTAIVGSVGGGLYGGTVNPTPPAILALFLVLDVLTVAVGVLIRRGRGWVLALNVVVVVLFVEFLALPSAIAVLYLVLDSVVLFALIRHRWWFDWRADDEAVELGERAERAGR
jgi:hypothetical protein